MTGRRAGGQDGATRATRATQSQVPLAAAAALSPRWRLKRSQEKLWKAARSSLCGRAPGDPPGSSCGCSGAQRRDKRSSHSRSVSPWLCHPLQRLSSSCSEQSRDLAPFVPNSFSFVWCLTLPSTSLLCHRSFGLLEELCCRILAPAPNQPGPAQVRGRRQRSGIVIPLGIALRPCAFKGKTARGGAGNVRSNFPFRVHLLQGEIPHRGPCGDRNHPKEGLGTSQS